MKTKYYLIGAITLPLILVCYFAWIIIYPPAFLPHEKIVIHVPYDSSNMPESMIPMGETLYHPKPQVPNGHPGIDFSWQNGNSHAMLASADGEIVSITQGTSDAGKWDIEIANGVYIMRYKEMEDYNRNLSKGSKIKQGDLVGHAGRYCDSQHCWFTIHWEFGSRSVIKDRYCPLTYFDEESRKSIEALWAKVPADDKVKSQFPNICSGDYYNKQE